MLLKPSDFSFLTSTAIAAEGMEQAETLTQPIPNYLLQHRSSFNSGKENMVDVAGAMLSRIILKHDSIPSEGSTMIIEVPPCLRRLCIPLRLLSVVCTLAMKTSPCRASLGNAHKGDVNLRRGEY